VAGQLVVEDSARLKDAGLACLLEALSKGGLSRWKHGMELLLHHGSPLRLINLLGSVNGCLLLQRLQYWRSGRSQVSQCSQKICWYLR